ncbi:MAG: ATP-dependent Clp protease proteolytic subunit [Armatimonadota bacterium]
MSEQNNYLVPIVVEQTPRGERSFDIYSRLLKERIVMVSWAIDDTLASSIIAQLLFLASDDDTERINMYINSPGGIVTAGLAVYDTMQYIRPEIHTWCIGQAGSIAAVLLAGGAPGKRAALPNAKVLIHQPWVSSMGGAAADVEIHAREIIRTRKRINEILSKHTGRDLPQLEQDTDRDYFMSAEEARDYGIVDFVAEEAPELAREE